MEYDRILIFKEPVLNKALEGHLIRTEKVSNEGNCRLKCYLEPNCVSVNVGPLDKGTHICELNNDTDESPSYLTLVERHLYTHHAVENPCHCQPCPGKYDVTAVRDIEGNDAIETSFTVQGHYVVPVTKN